MANGFPLLPSELAEKFSRLVFDWLQFDEALTQDENFTLASAFGMAARNETSLVIVASNKHFVVMYNQKAFRGDNIEGIENKFLSIARASNCKMIDRPGFLLSCQLKEGHEPSDTLEVLDGVFEQYHSSRKMTLSA